MERIKKHSYKRDAILACLRGTKTHPAAEWIYDQLKPQIPDLSLGTVYRNLAGFRADGTIVSVGTVNGNERFDANTVPHAHFICRHCGSIIDLEDIPLTLPAVQCGVITGCQISYTGVCNRCAENKK